MAIEKHQRNCKGVRSQPPGGLNRVKALAPGRLKTKRGYRCSP